MEEKDKLQIRRLKEDHTIKPFDCGDDDLREIVNLNVPYLTWRNFPKVEETFGKLNGTLISTISLNEFC